MTKTIDTSDLGHTLRWIGGILVAIILSCIGAGASYMSTAVAKNTTDIVDLRLNDAHLDTDIQVLDSKLNFIIQMNGGQYVGPILHQHNDSKDGKR